MHLKSYQYDLFMESEHTVISTLRWNVYVCTCVYMCTCMSVCACMCDYLYAVCVFQMHNHCEHPYNDPKVAEYSKGSLSTSRFCTAGISALPSYRPGKYGINTERTDGIGCVT